MTDYLDKLKKQKKPTAFDWQQKALDAWEKMGCVGKITATFMKIFRNEPAIAQQCYSWVIDYGARTPEHLFYWRYNQLKKECSI